MEKYSRNKTGRTEYFLCPIYDGYEIVEHDSNEPEGRGGLCFHVDEDAVSDGDGFPASYDDTYIKIEEKDYLHVIGLFHKAGQEMDAIAIKHGKPISRSIAPGDYIYHDGYFIHVQNISDDRERLWIEEFFYNGYDLIVDLDLDMVSKENEYDIEEMEPEGLLITAEIYREALDRPRSAMREIAGYLAELFKAGKSIETNINQD